MLRLLVVSVLLVELSSAGTAKLNDRLLQDIGCYDINNIKGGKSNKDYDRSTWQPTGTGTIFQIGSTAVKIMDQFFHVEMINWQHVGAVCELKTTGITLGQIWVTDAGNPKIPNEASKLGDISANHFKFWVRSRKSHSLTSRFQFYGSYTDARAAGRTPPTVECIRVNTLFVPRHTPPSPREGCDFSSFPRIP